MSQIIRYVKVNIDKDGLPRDFEIRESYLGFREITSQTAVGLENEIVSSLEENGLHLNKCRGQGYDGAANMSGIYSGVQARIAKIEPNAVYVHCAAHNLNLALNDSVQNISEMRNFYDTVEQLCNFFGSSIKRWAMLKELACVSEVIGKVTLKRLCPTRWSSRHDSLVALRFRYSDVVKVLSKISLFSESHDE